MLGERELLFRADQLAGDDRFRTGFHFQPAAQPAAAKFTVMNDPNGAFVDPRTGVRIAHYCESVLGRAGIPWETFKRLSHWSVPARVTKRHVAWYFPQRILLFRSAKAVTSYELVTSKSVPAPVTQAGPTMCIRVIKC